MERQMYIGCVLHMVDDYIKQNPNSLSFTLDITKPMRRFQDTTRTYIPNDELKEIVSLASCLEGRQFVINIGFQRGYDPYNLSIMFVRGEGKTQNA